MVKYRVIFGYTFEVVEVEERTTDLGAILDLCIDQLEEKGYTGCFIEYEETEEGGGDMADDLYVTGGNHGLLLYHGGNFMIEEVEENEVTE